MKGKTQLPQLPDDGDEDADGDGDVVVGGDVHSEYFVMMNNVGCNGRFLLPLFTNSSTL